MAANALDRSPPASFPIGGFRDDATRSTTLPSDWYYEPSVFEREKQAIFYRTWSYQCHVSDLRNPGDYFVGEVVDQSIFLIRDQTGALRGFYNVNTVVLCTNAYADADGLRPLIDNAANAVREASTDLDRPR